MKISLFGSLLVFVSLHTAQAQVNSAAQDTSSLKKVIVTGAFESQSKKVGFYIHDTEDLKGVDGKSIGTLTMVGDYGALPKFDLIGAPQSFTFESDDKVDEASNTIASCATPEHPVEMTLDTAHFKVISVVGTQCE